MDNGESEAIFGVFLLGWIILINLIGMVLVLIIKPKGPNRFGARGVSRKPLEAISTCFGHYIAANGRASRSEYWWFFLTCFLLVIVLDVLGSVLHTQVFRLGTYGFFLPLLTAQIRRLHDINRSGWWVLLNLSLIPVTLWVLYAQRAKDTDAETVAAAF